MSDKNDGRMVRLLPNRGKFLSAHMPGGIIEIESVNAASGSVGTLVPYDLAVRLLKANPPICVVCPDQSNGGANIDEEDVSAIRASQEAYFNNNSGFRAHADKKAEPLVVVREQMDVESAKAIEALKKQLSDKDSKLEEQAKKIERITATVNQLVEAQAVKK